MAMCHAYSVCSSGVGGVSSLDTLLTRDARLLLLMSLLFFLLACCGPCGTRAALSTHLPMRSCVLCACVAAAALYLYDPRTAQRCIYEGGKGRGRQQKGNAVEMGSEQRSRQCPRLQWGAVAREWRQQQQQMQVWFVWWWLCTCWTDHAIRNDIIIAPRAPPETCRNYMYGLYGRDGESTADQPLACLGSAPPSFHPGVCVHALTTPNFTLGDVHSRRIHTPASGEQVETPCSCGKGDVHSRRIHTPASGEQVDPLVHVEEALDRVSGVNALDGLGEELADRDLADLARFPVHFGRERDGVCNDDL
eukprot:scaffold1146_cov106-Isochrysis_galbana.AAC.1